MEGSNAKLALLVLHVALTSVAIVPAARAGVPLYWDGDGTGTVAGGAGTWDLTLERWSPTPDGNVYQAWVNANQDDAVFGTTGGAVTLSGALVARSLDVGVNGYSFGGTGSLTLAGSSFGTINVATGTATMGANLAGADGFTKTGPGTLVFTANSSVTGNRRITGGQVRIDAATRFTSSGTVTLDGGTLVQTNPGSGGSYVPGTVAIDVGTGGGTVSYTGGAGSSSIYTGTIRGPGNTLHKTGTGEFRYQGAGLPNTTYAKLFVHQGLFRLGAGTSDERGFGAVPSTFTADAITLDGGAIGTSFNTSLHPNRGITLGPAGGTFNTGSGAATIQSSITGVGGLTKTGAQNLRLTATSDFQGPFTLLDNRVEVWANDALGAGNLAITLAGASSGTLVNNVSPSGAVVVLNNPVITLLNTGTGAIDISANSGNTLELTGKITGTANWKKDNAASTGSLVLSNATSDFTGDLNVVGGRLVITANNALGSTAGVTTIGTNASLVLRGGFDYAAAEPVFIGGSGVSSGGAIQNVSGDNRFAGAITLTNHSSVAVPAGSLELAGPIGGSFALGKDGPGTLVLSGPSNAVTQLNINGGTVSVSTDAHLGAVPAVPTVGRIVIGAGTALRTTDSFAIHPNRGITLLGGAGGVDVAPGHTLAYDGAFAGSALAKFGGGTLALGGTGAHTDGTTIHAGTIALSSTASLPGNVAVAAAGALGGTGSVGGNVVVSGAIAPGHGQAPGTLATAGDHDWAAGGTYVWKIDDATGSAGVDWDQLTMNALSVSATAPGKFRVKVVAQPGKGTPALDNFDPNAPFAWIIAVATSGTVTSFDLEKFEIDLTQFEDNNENKGGFYLSRSGGEVSIHYVPEPGSATLVLCAAASLLRRRRRA